MNIVVALPLNSFDSISEAFEFVDSFLVFDKAGILSNNNEGYINYDLNLINEHFKKEKPLTFQIVSNFSSSLDFRNSLVYRRNEEECLHYFGFGIENLQQIRFKEFLDASTRKGFTMAFIYDLIKSKWQREIVIQNYKAFNKPYSHLPKKWDPVLSPILGEIVDISKNPGRSVETYEMVLMAAPEMWFGPGSWKYFDKKAVLSFPNALENKEIIPDVVYIKLFDWENSDYESPEILALQKKFREWTKMDEIEEELEKKVSMPTQVAHMKIDVTDAGNPKEEFNIYDLISRKKKKK